MNALLNWKTGSKRAAPLGSKTLLKMKDIITVIVRF